MSMLETDRRCRCGGGMWQDGSERSIEVVGAEAAHPKKSGRLVNFKPKKETYPVRPRYYILVCVPVGFLDLHVFNRVFPSRGSEMAVNPSGGSTMVEIPVEGLQWCKSHWRV